MGTESRSGRWQGEVFRFPDHPQERHRHHSEDQGSNSGCLRGKLKGNGKSVPALAAIKTPLRDGDIERPDDEAYANAYFVNANSITAPEIVDADRQPILTHSEVYSGVYGRASINFYAYNTGTARGIACGLGNLQKLRDGEPLGSRSSAEDDFADLDDEDDDDFLN